MRLITIVLFGWFFGSDIEAHPHEDEVVIRILGGPKLAKFLADEMGYLYKGPVSVCKCCKVL